MSYYNSNAGLAYLAKPDRKYKHLRNMLTACWNIKGVHPSDRFEIDTHFGYSLEAITKFIQNKFDAHTIEQAHYKAQEAYNGRGRPKGARNKPSFADASPIIDYNAPSIIDEILPDAPKALPAPKSDDNAKLDASEFVLKRVHDKDITLLANEIDKVSETIDRQRDDNANFYSNVLDKLNVFEAELNKRRVVSVEIQPYNAPKIDLGRQHMAFPDLLALCCAAIEAQEEPLNVWLYGPAGTGKTTAAKNIANALTLAYKRTFDFRALSKLSTEYQVLGYQDAAGNYVTTHFRQIYEHGGVIILDEIDSWSPNAMTALNGALANGYCAFPDKMVTRHKDCIIIAGANTVGSGGTIEYVGRLKQDAASLDRFEMMEWPIDEALEAALTNNDQWLQRVRHVRKQVAAKGIKDVMITPRAAIKGAARIRAGISFEMAEKLFLRRGMTEAQWDMVK